jgi:hypothetical protein
VKIEVICHQSVAQKSRPELVEQIRPIAPDLAKCLSELLDKSPHAVRFGRLLDRLRRTFREIDPEVYWDCDERLKRAVAGAKMYAGEETFDKAGAEKARLAECDRCSRAATLIRK